MPRPQISGQQINRATRWLSPEHRWGVRIRKKETGSSGAIGRHLPYVGCRPGERRLVLGGEAVEQVVVVKPFGLIVDTSRLSQRSFGHRAQIQDGQAPHADAIELF